MTQEQHKVDAVCNAFMYANGVAWRPIDQPVCDAYLMAGEAGGATPEQEQIISKIPSYAFMYAKYIAKGKCSDVIEKSISDDWGYSYLYARDVIVGRCPGVIEKAILQSNVRPCQYALVCAYYEVVNGNR